MQDAAAVPGSRPGGKEESWAGEDQEPEEVVQTEDPGEHWQTEAEATEEETVEEKKDSSGFGLNSPVYPCTYSPICPTDSSHKINLKSTAFIDSFNRKPPCCDETSLQISQSLRQIYIMSRSPHLPNSAGWP